MVEHNQSSYYNNGYKFNGKELDEATGMYYYGARYYDPRISIFISVDPLAEETMEPYSYVSNNPINLIDPTGMGPEDFRVKKIGNQFNIETTVHIYGTNASESIATEMTKVFRDANKVTSVGENGETMSINVTVKYHTSKESAIEAVKSIPGDNLLDISNEIDTKDFNLYDPETLNRLTNLDASGFAKGGGGEGKATNLYNGIHEIGHFLGLGERYKVKYGLPICDPEFRNDIMGNDRHTEIKSVHYQNLYNHISNEENEYTTQENIRIYRDTGIIQE